MRDEGRGDAGRGPLGPPPREVPLKLRAQVLTNAGVLIGALIFGIGSPIGLVAILAAHPLDAWRLAGAARQAPGRLRAVEATQYHENDLPVYRCRYTFPTPDGVEHRGVCYRVGGQAGIPLRPAPVGPRRQPQVVVRYDPRHPESSCIRGMRVGLMAPWFSLLLALPALLGLLVAIGGVLFGRRKIRLLADGQPARATLISCHLFGGQDHPEVPFDPFRQSWLGQTPPGGDGGRTAGSGPPSIVGLAPMPRVSSRAIPAARWFIHFWTCGVIVVFSIGTLVLAGVLVLLVLRRPPFHHGGNGTAALQLFVGVFLVGWIALGPLLLRVGRTVRSGLSGRAPAGGRHRDSNPTIQCTFEYRLPGGEVVRAVDTVRFSSRLGDEPTEPILYDPMEPGRAILLDGLWPAVRVSPFGEWQPAEGATPWLRAALVVGCFVAGPWIGWLAWQAA